MPHLSRCRKSAAELQVGEIFQHLNGFARVVFRDEPIMPLLSSAIPMTIEHGMLGRLAFNALPQEQVVVVEYVSNAVPTRDVFDVWETEWFSARAESEFAFEQSEIDTMSQKVILEGYGLRVGQTLEASCIRHTSNQAIIVMKEQVNGKVERKMIPFDRKTGLPMKAGAHDGYKISEKSLHDLGEPTKRTKAKSSDGELKEKKVKKVKNPGGFCWCGCGVQTNEGSRFKQGHDARYHSWVKQVLDGRMVANDFAGKIIPPKVLEKVMEEGGPGSHKSDTKKLHDTQDAAKHPTVSPPPKTNPAPGATGQTIPTA